jgi:hydrogenase maturation protein HypF
VVRYRVQVQGLVQGVGFRPFVWRLATRLRCSGWVRNDDRGVHIEVQGSDLDVQQFLQELPNAAPPQSKIFSLICEIIPNCNLELGFQILDSWHSKTPQCVVSPDIATCQDCLEELRDPKNRRFAYPFTNCTNCGPRFTIQMSVPYDRTRTTMRDFVLCDRCRVEYESPDDRRFHAEPNACPECGPAIWFQSNEYSGLPGEPHGGDEPIRQVGCAPARQSDEVLATIGQVRKAIAAGKVVAIKGIGGFHLACDARNPAAIDLLRERKRRPFKPLAVMVADLETASGIAHVCESSLQLLNSYSRPIVLMPKIAEVLPETVTPNNPYLGVLLPYSPLHHLLLRPGDVWVMTSGNLADEPIVSQNEDALVRLKPLADAFLLHDRSIYTVCDDSVVRSCALGVVPIRRSRGYAPLPIQMSYGKGQPEDDSSEEQVVTASNSIVMSEVGIVRKEPTILAVGGELKTALCLLVGSQAVMGQHIGDMGHRETLDALNRSRDHLLSLYRVKPEMVAADLHPGYISTAWAKQLAKDWNIPIIQVQHHHAHAVSLIAEHGLPADQPIIACVLDGTGYGTDGAIWGGEVLVASASSFRRVAHIEYLPLPGGDSAILEPAKTALAFLHGCGLNWNKQLPSVQHFSDQLLELLRRQLEKNVNTAKTSSMGRLFDAVASLIGIRHEIDYEGQAALELEALAEEGFRSHSDIQAYGCHWSKDSVSQLRVCKILEEICNDVCQGVEPALIAARFHQTVACCLVAICRRLKDENSAKSNLNLNSQSVNQSQYTAGLTGGVFQNTVLSQLVHASLEAAGFRVLTHHHVPPNDGGLALGQALIARRQQTYSQW